MRLLLAALCLLALGIGTAQAFTPPFKLASVAPGDYVHIGEMASFTDKDHDDIANLGLVVGTRCAAVIDTGGSVTTGRAFREAVAKITKLPVCYVINTHWHPDHTFGNLAFQDKGTVFVGSARLPGEFAQRRKDLAAGFAQDLGTDPQMAIIAPTRLVKTTLKLDLGGRTLTLKAWPKAHTDTDVTVMDDQTQVLWTGDLLFRNRVPALDGSLDGWLKVLPILAAMKAKIVVPGHGPVGHDLADDIKPEHHYLKTLRDETCQYIGAGGTLEDAAQKIMPDNTGHWLLWSQHQPLNVKRAYIELQWSCF